MGAAAAQRPETLSGRFDQLGQQLTAIVPANKVYLTEYWDPAPTTTAPAPRIRSPARGSRGGARDVLAPNESDRKWGYENGVVPLNAAIQAAATTWNFHYVGGIAADFYRHGLCATNSWIVSPTEWMDGRATSSARGTPTSQGSRTSPNRLLSSGAFSITLPTPGATTSGGTANGGSMIHPARAVVAASTSPAAPRPTEPDLSSMTASTTRNSSGCTPAASCGCTVIPPNAWMPTRPPTVSTGQRSRSGTATAAPTSSGRSRPTARFARWPTAAAWTRSERHGQRHPAATVRLQRREQPGLDRRPTPNGGAAIRGAGSARCLDVPGLAISPGTRPQLYERNGGANQQWKLVSGQLQVYTDKCLDVTGNGTANGTPVQIWTCNGAPQQQWTLQSDGTTIRSAPSGRCPQSSSVGYGTVNGTTLQIWDCNRTSNQLRTHA